MTFRKMKSSKKKAVEGVEVVLTVRPVLEGEAISIAPIFEVVRTEAKIFVVPLEALGDTVMMKEPSNAVAKVVDEAEAPSREGPPM